MGKLSGVEAVVTSELEQEEEEAVEGEGESLRNFLEVGNLGFLRKDLMDLL